MVVLLIVLPRITPACAGNRSLSSSVIAGSKDHPRVCGEQCSHRLLLLLCVGSPPRVRGTVEEETGEPWEIGITPACAGNRGRASDAGIMS